MIIKKKKRKTEIFLPSVKFGKFPSPTFPFSNFLPAFFTKGIMGFLLLSHACWLSCLLANWSVCVYMCVFVCVLVTHSYLSLCVPVDCSPPDSSVHRILRQEYWIAIPFSRVSSPGIKPGSPALQTDCLSNQGSPKLKYSLFIILY